MQGCGLQRLGQEKAAWLVALRPLRRETDMPDGPHMTAPTNAAASFLPRRRTSDFDLDQIQGRRARAIVNNGLTLYETGVECRSDASDVGLMARGVKKQCAKGRGSVHFQPPAVR